MPGRVIIQKTVVHNSEKTKTGEKGETHMKIIKKLATLFLVVCLAVPCFSLVAFAAEGTLMFSDPTTKVGENLEVTVKIQSGAAAIGDGKATVTYDKEALEFISGTNASGGDGKLELSATGNGTETELAYQLQFKALKEGDTTLQVSEYSAYLYSNETLNLTLGTSLVKIEPGTGEAAPSESEKSSETTGIKVTIDGETYTISEAFSEAQIPGGYSETEMSYEGQTIKVIQNAVGQFMIYLQPESGDAEFFLYNGETAKYSQFEQVFISTDHYILIMQDTTGVALPDTYQKTAITMGDKEFPAWQDTKNSQFYIVNALNNAGVTGLYQYDKDEETYQRFIAPEINEEKEATGKIAKLVEFMKDHLDKFLIGAWAVFLIMLIIIIVIAVKLHRRNSELDELYDEYEIDEEEEPAPVPVKVKEEKPVAAKEKKSRFKKKEPEEVYEEEEIPYEEEESYYDDDESYYEDEDEDDDFSTGFFDDDDDDDDFKVDFIDLDD